MEGLQRSRNADLILILCHLPEHCKTVNHIYCSRSILLPIPPLGLTLMYRNIREGEPAFRRALFPSLTRRDLLQAGVLKEYTGMHKEVKEALRLTVSWEQFQLVFGVICFNSCFLRNTCSAFLMECFLLCGSIFMSGTKQPVIPPSVSLSLSLSVSFSPHPSLHPSITPLQTGLSLWGALSFPLG